MCQGGRLARAGGNGGVVEKRSSGHTGRGEREQGDSPVDWYLSQSCRTLWAGWVRFPDGAVVFLPRGDQADGIEGLMLVTEVRVIRAGRVRGGDGGP